MLYRLSLRLLLVTLIASLLLIGIGLIIGRALPPDLQFLWAAPHKNRWQEVAETAPFPVNAGLYSIFHQDGGGYSTVGLYSTRRQLSAVRHLPVQNVSGYWNANGDYAILYGDQDGASYTYQMSFTRDASRTDQLPTSVDQPISPDGRWLVVYQRDASGQPVGLKAVPVAQRDQVAAETANEDDLHLGWDGYITWADDSSQFIYGWNPYGTSPQPNELQVIETRLYHVETQTEELLNVMDSSLGIDFDPASDFQLRFIAKPQPLPADVMADKTLQYNTELYNYRTGERFFLSTQGLYYPTWSRDGRYLLLMEYTSTLAQRTTQAVFEAASSGWTSWNVLYHPASHTLIPTAEINQSLYYPYYSGWGGSFFGSTAGLPYGPRSYRIQTSLFDTQTGEKTQIGSSEAYGSDYYVQWLTNSDILTISASDPTAQYTLRPGGDPKLLQFEGDELVTSFNGLYTVATRLKVAPSRQNFTPSVPGMAPPPPGQIYTVPTYYFVDFEHDVVTPLALDKDELLGGVDFTLSYSGINVGVMTTTIYRTSQTTTSTTSPVMNVYLLTEHGVIRVAEGLSNVYPQSFAVAPDEFILLLTEYTAQGNPANSAQILDFTNRLGVWQQSALRADVTGWLSWRPKPTDRAANP